MKHNVYTNQDTISNQDEEQHSTKISDSSHWNCFEISGISLIAFGRLSSSIFNNPLFHRDFNHNLSRCIPLLLVPVFFFRHKSNTSSIQTLTMTVEKLGKQNFNKFQYSKCNISIPLRLVRHCSKFNVVVCLQLLHNMR